MNKIILASSSIYRQELLKRLSINFSSISPNIDEARMNGENFEDLARRLSNEKAEAVSIKNPSAFVIGSDQTAELNKREVRKPLSIERAFIQLNELSGQTLNFFSGVCLKNAQKNISVDEAKEKLNDPNVQFIDVRDKNSFESETIGNAVNLERGLLEFYLADGSPLENEMFKKNPDKEYIVFCGLGGQSTLATKTMQEMGIKNVKNMTGGMTAWKDKK